MMQRIWNHSRSYAATVTVKRNHLSIGRTMATSKWTVDSDTGIVSSSSTSQKFQTVIGLEIHAQLDIPDKLFSAAPSSSSSSSPGSTKPNTMVYPMDLGVPGFLPQLSQSAVQAAVLSAAALQCHIPYKSRFERKHYFYADLPLGYQITQQQWPLAKDGRLVCHYNNQGKSKKRSKSKKSSSANTSSSDSSFMARIERIQLEQDTGKTILMTSSASSSSSSPSSLNVDSLVDFNRAGCALIEIVFYPDLRSSVQAAIAVETLRTLLRHIGTCNGKMEEGSLRCDLNVSISPINESDGNNDDTITLEDQTKALLQNAGNRVEVKNLNSLRQVQLAAEYEAIRQAQAHVDGNPTAQETRTFHVKSNQTVVIRTKEVAKDYRFMPDPDLPPLILHSKAFDGMELNEFLETKLPELPEQARQRLQRDYGLSEYLSNVITGDPPAIPMFDQAVQSALLDLGQRNELSSNTTLDTSNVYESVANLLCNELFALVREHETAKALLDDDMEGGEASVKYSAVTSTQLGQVAALLVEGTISNTMAKHLLRLLYTETETVGGMSVREVAQKRGFQLITDVSELAQICHQVMEENPTEMEKYKLGGKFARKISKFLLGKAMQKSQGNAHPERLNEIMEEVLEEVAPDVER